jgi:hypothetical protein
VGDDPTDYYDCRSSDSHAGRVEHIFLHHMIQYTQEPEVFRERLRTEPNLAYRSQLIASYAWLREHWFEGLEFHTLAAAGAEMQQTGLPCGPGQCTLASPRQRSFHRGDSNASGATDLSDGVLIFRHLFQGDPATLACRESADANSDGVIDLSDGVHILRWLFNGGPPPGAPGPPGQPCGSDPDPPGSPGDLGCEEYAACP